MLEGTNSEHAILQRPVGGLMQELALKHGIQVVFTDTAPKREVIENTIRQIGADWYSFARRLDPAQFSAAIALVRQRPDS